MLHRFQKISTHRRIMYIAKSENIYYYAIQQFLAIEIVIIQITSQSHLNCGLDRKHFIININF